jgi:hypothetical protein
MIFSQLWVRCMKKKNFNPFTNLNSFNPRLNARIITAQNGTNLVKMTRNLPKLPLWPKEKFPQLFHIYNNCGKWKFQPSWSPASTLCALVFSKTEGFMGIFEVLTMLFIQICFNLTDNTFKNPNWWHWEWKIKMMFPQTFIARKISWFTVFRQTVHSFHYWYSGLYFLFRDEMGIFLVNLSIFGDPQIGCSWSMFCIYVIIFSSTASGFEDNLISQLIMLLHTSTLNTKEFWEYFPQNITNIWWYQEWVTCSFLLRLGVRCRKQFCLLWVPRAVDFKVFCSLIPRHRVESPMS